MDSQPATIHTDQTITTVYTVGDRQMGLATKESMNSRMQLKKYQAGSAVFADIHRPSPPKTPSEWFSHKFPPHASIYGAPLLEEEYTALENGEPTLRIRPVALNEDFFAAVLGGESSLGHQVVYYLPEGIFYFFDPREGCFVQTMESKLLTLLSQYLIRCAEAQDNHVDVAPLFNQLREEKQLKRIITRAKSVLAAEEAFFMSPQGHKRKVGQGILDPTLTPPHKRFVLEGVTEEPKQVLTVNDAYEKFSRYCDNHGFRPVERKHFKRLIAEAVREEFGLGLRHDLNVDGGKATQGWMGLTCRLAPNDHTKARN